MFRCPPVASIRLVSCPVCGRGGAVSRRAKLIEKMHNAPGTIRFAQVAALMRHEGFVLFNIRGSHRTYHHSDGRLLTLAVPHGKRKTCHPEDIRKLDRKSVV